MSISLSAAMLGATILALNNNKTVKADTTDNNHLETDSNGQNDPVVQAKRQEFNRDRTKNESIAGELKKAMSDDESSSNHSSLPKQEFNQDRTKTRVKINKKYLTKNEQTRPKSYLGNEEKRAEYAKADDLLKSELTNKNSSANESLINSKLVNNNALFNLQTNDQNNTDNIQLSRQNNDNKNTINAQEDDNKSNTTTNFGTINLVDYQALDLNSFNLPKNSINTNTTIKMLNENKVQISDDELKRKANYWGRTNGQITQDDLNFLNNNVGQNGHKFYLSSIGYTSEAESTPKAKESHTEIVGNVKPQNNRIDTAVRNSFSGDLDDAFKHTFTIDKDAYNQNIGGHILISDIIQFDNVDSQYGSYFMNTYVLNNNNEIRDQYHNVVGYLGISTNYSPKGNIREDKLWLNIPSSAQKVGIDITSTFAGDYFNDDSYSWANVFNHTSKAPDGKWQTELLLDKDHVNFIGKTRDVNQDTQPVYVENSSNNNTAASVDYKVFSLGFNHQENINHTQVEHSHQVIKLEALGLDEKNNTKLVDLPITQFYPSIQTFDALDAGNNQQIIMFRKDIGLDRVYLADNLTSNEIYEAATQNKNKIVISKQSDNSLLVGYDLSTDCVKQDKQQLLYDLKCSYYLNYQHPELKDEITNRTIQAYENRNWNVTTFNTQAWFATDNNRFKAIRETLLTPGQEINSNTYYGNSNIADSKTQYDSVIPVRYVDDDTGQTINNSVINAVSGSTVSIDPLLDITPLPNYVFNNINTIDYGLVKPKDNKEIVIHIKQKIFNTTPISYDSGSLSSPTRKVVGNENSDLDNLLNRYRSDPNVTIIQDSDVFYHPNDDDQNDVVNAFKKANTDNFNQYNNIVQQIKDWQKKQADLEIHYHHNIVRPEIKRDYHVNEIMPQAKYGRDKTIIGVKAALKRDASMNMTTGRIMNGYFGLDHGSNNSYNPNSGIDHDEYSWYGNNVQLNPQDPTKASVIADSIPGYHSYQMSTGSGTSFNPNNDPWHTWGKFMNVDFNRTTNRVTMNMFEGLEPNSAIGQENHQIMYTPSYTSRTIYFVDTDAEQNHENASDVRKGNSSDQISKEITDANHIILNKSIGTTGTVDTTSEFDLTGNIIYQTLYSEGYRLVDSPKLTIDYNNYQDKDGNWHVQTGPIYVRLKHGTQDVTETDPYTKFQMKNVVKYHEQGYSLANPNDQVNHENTLTIGLTRKATKDLVTGDVFYGKWTIDQSNAKNAYDTETLLKGYIPIDGNSRRGYATYITQNSRDGDDQINKQNAYHNLVRSGHLAIGVAPNIRLVNSDKKGYDFAPGITNNDLNKDVYIYANNHDAFSNQIDVYYVPWKRHLKANIYAGDKNVLLNDHPDLSGVSFTGDTIQIDWSKLKPEYRQSAHDLPEKYTFDVPDDDGVGDYYKQLHDLDPDDNYDPYINDENPDKALEHGNDYLPIYIDGVYKKLPDEKRTITRIIQVNNNGKMQEVKRDQVEISRSVVQEVLSGKKIYGDWTSGKFERYDIPQRDGYYSVIERDGNTDETKTINELEVDEDSPVRIVYTINYAKDQAQQQVNFVTKLGVRIADETIEGSLGDKKDVDQTVIPEGWKLISSPTVVINNGISNLIVVHDPYKVPHDDYVVPNTPIVGDLVYPSGLDEKDLNQAVTRTINLHYPTGEVKSIVQEIEFTRTGYFNPNTGQVYYDGWESENNVFEKYDVPSVDGYTPSQSEVATKEIASPIANETVDIYYSAGNRTILINYRDNSDSGNDTKTSHREEYEGNVSTVKKINIDLSNGEELDHLGIGYSFVYNNGQYLIKANKDLTDSDHVLSLNNMRTLRGQKHFILEYTFSEVNLPFEIFTNHTMQEVTAKDSEYANLHKTVSRNIYVYQPDGTLLPPITESVSFVRTAVKDMSTGKITYTPWKLEKDKTKSLGVIKSFKANNIDGYDTLNPANNQDITVDPNNDVNTDLKDVVISYAPKMQKSAIIFVQKGANKYDSARNVEINGQTYEIIGGRTFTGRTNEIVSLKEYQHDYTIPVGYKAVNTAHSGLWNHIPDSYKFKADGNKPIYIEVIKDKL